MLSASLLKDEPRNSTQVPLVARTLRLSAKDFMHSGLCWGSIGVILGLHRGYIGVILGLYWGYIGVMMGIYQGPRRCTWRPSGQPDDGSILRQQFHRGLQQMSAAGSLKRRTKVIHQRILRGFFYQAVQLYCLYGIRFSK